MGKPTTKTNSLKTLLPMWTLVGGGLWPAWMCQLEGAGLAGCGGLRGLPGQLGAGPCKAMAPHTWLAVATTSPTQCTSPVWHCSHTTAHPAHPPTPLGAGCPAHPLPGLCHGPQAHLLRWVVAGGAGILPPHPTRAHELHTQCYVLGSAQKWLKEHKTTFRLQPHGSKSSSPSSPNRGYLKVRACSLGEPHPEFYLHHLICHLYHGPPPSPSLVCMHKCQHKLCVLPWHLEWGTQSDNVAQGWAMRHHRWL